MQIKRQKQHDKTNISAQENGGIDYFANLCDNLVLCILRFLPDELLRAVLKYVCKRWSHLINNNIFSIQTSLVIQKPNRENRKIYDTRLVSFIQGKSSMWVSEKFLNISCQGCIRSWCNEVLLIFDPNQHGALYVYNLRTKQGSILPVRSPSSVCKGHSRKKCGLGLVFDKNNRLYKVVHVFVSRYRVECEVLSVEYKSSSFTFSKWRNIEGPSVEGENIYHWEDTIISVRGRYLHWNVHSTEHVLSLDIHEEVFLKTTLPSKYMFDLHKKGYHLVEMGGVLTVVLPYPFVDFIYVLTDICRSEWVKLRRAGCLPSRFENISRCSFGNSGLFPIAGFKDGSNIIFKRSCIYHHPGLYTHKVRKLRAMAKLEIRVEAKERCVVQSISEHLDE